MARRKGSRSRAVTVNNGRYKIWQTMRLLKKNGSGFTAADLMAAAEVGEANVGTFLRGLLRYGYVAVTREKISGKRAGDRVYRLVKDTGPMPPRLFRDGAGLYDPNTGRTLQPSEKDITRTLPRAAAGQEQEDGARLD